MKKIRFYFKLISKGRLANVRFYPEEENISIRIIPNSDYKEWTCKEFELLVEDPFEYVLHVFGVSGTGWEAELKIYDGKEKVDFIQWEGKTGDSKRNISIRKKPTKNIPS